MTSAHNKANSYWRAESVFAMLILLVGFAIRGFGQDTRVVTEPTFPATCAVYHAPLLSTANGPAIGSDKDGQNNESSSETLTLNTYLKKCADSSPGQAVELALGSDSSFNAFLLNPIAIPPGVSLILDGGVTVYATRDPANYQNPDEPQVHCGTVGENYPVNGGCVAFITLSEKSGIYGYGILDGQGNQPIFSMPQTPTLPPPPAISWWDLITSDKKSCSPEDNCQEASPQMISAGNSRDGNSSNSDFVFYKFTIRNPQFHTVNLGGTNHTVWDVKIQAPWNVPNTDGFDIHANNVTVYDTTVANGDQEIAFSATPELATGDITVDHFHGYSKGGITILGNSGAFSNILIQNTGITGDLPQVLVSKHIVNGMSEAEMWKIQPSLKGYEQALPNATGDLKALQITTNINPSSTTKGRALISNVTFQSSCIRDIIKPINIVPVVPFKPTDEYLPVLQNVTFKDIHILSPTSQFPSMVKGVPTGSQGTYEVAFDAYPGQGNQAQYINQFTLNNVVFDDTAAGATSLGSISAVGNDINAETNLYPAVINELGSPYVESPHRMNIGGTSVILSANSYASTTAVSNPALAFDCTEDPTPFITGELYISKGNDTNLPIASVSAGNSVTLNAVVEPTMSQTTHYVANSYGADPGLLAVGSPALSNSINFYEGAILVGSASLSANGTLASLVLKNISAGTHIYTAQYPADNYYPGLSFGSVIVTAVPPAATRTFLSASATTITTGENVTFTVKVAAIPGNLGTPSGSVTFLDGEIPLNFVSLDPTGSGTYSTSMLFLGNHAITAIYSGDPNFASSISSVLAVTTKAPPLGDFSVSLIPDSLTLSEFTPSTATLNVTPVNGFSSTVTFACVGLPAGVSCNFTPSTILVSGNAALSTVVTISTVSTNTVNLERTRLATLAFTMGGWLLMGRRKRYRMAGLALGFLIVTAWGLTGCGSRSTTLVTATKVNITATAGSTSRSAQLLLTYVKAN